jgi:hypothetical protein
MLKTAKSKVGNYKLEQNWMKLPFNIIYIYIYIYIYYICTIKGLGL